MNPQALIESVNYEGRGIAHRDGKVVFIEGAITGETVTYSAYRKKESFERKSSFVTDMRECHVLPPREGAIALVSALPAWGDANVLVHTKGYVLKTAGVVNLFPQTSHVESIAVFERGETMPPPLP